MDVEGQRENTQPTAAGSCHRQEIGGGGTAQSLRGWDLRRKQ